MPTSELAPGTTVRAPFPRIDAAARQHGPALVVASAGPGPEPFPLWVVMINAAANRGWSGDVEAPDATATGLPATSVIRTAKNATIDAARAEAPGAAGAATLAAARAVITRRLDSVPAR